LIHGAAGGVGVFAVQLARWAGAHVIVTASARNNDFLRELGANQIIDYTTTRFEEVVHEVDLVFETSCAAGAPQRMKKDILEVATFQKKTTNGIR